MSSPIQADEDEVEEEVEFVSEAPVRPVLDCIDLLSDSEDEGCSSFVDTIQDKIDRHKAHVISTLDRLAHQVAQDKQARADKCRAFKEKQNSQKAQRQQELSSSMNGSRQEARRCVDMWLKMPGPKPGSISSGSGRRHRPSSFPGSTSTKHTCPVINCGRVFDHMSLLDGHLKRFDHSPCDPTLNLKGSPSELFACVACGQYFQTKGAWRTHLESKVSSSSAEGHSITQTYQLIVCFACPACYHLFNLRDECLQHMSAKNHFTEALAMDEVKGRAQPVPIPQHAKNRLIALCKDTTFNVRCSLCHKVLTSHQVAQAHFTVHCRQGCAVAKADKTVTQVMKQLQARGQCSLCCKIFLGRAEMESHKESTQHEVEVNTTMAKALLQYRRFSEIQLTKEAQEKRPFAGPETPSRKRNKNRDAEELPTKRQRLIVNSSSQSVTAWFCECGLRFSEEATASAHLLAVNQIFHQCGVCRKRMGESSITRLHMSRFHGGAHLSNFLLYCRKCKLEMPRLEDILSHVSETHSGHTFITEREVAPEEVAREKPSTSSNVGPCPSSKTAIRPDTPAAAPPTWMCRMCEDIFDSEAAVRKHCGAVSSHNFQRFICGHCPQKFFKESTVRRHCMNEHDGQIQSAHFCGLCDSMQFESEGEFLQHYESIHSKDYYCMDDADVVQPAASAAAAESVGQPSCTCPCMGSEKSKEEIKALYTQCMRNLAADGKCIYACSPCGVSMPSYAQIKTHVHTKHAALNLDKTFDVECKACQERFTDVPSFHKHHHSRHCALEPCASSRSRRKDVKAEPTAVKIIDAVELKPETNEIEDEALVKFLNMKQAEEQGEANENESDEEMEQEVAGSAEEERESAGIKVCGCMCVQQLEEEPHLV